MILGKSPFSLSPDGKELAFILTRGQAQDDTICHGVVVLRLADHAVRLIDLGGEQILNFGNLRGADHPSGEAAILRPVWSPDGQWIAYLRRDQGITQAWRAKVDGSHVEAITSLSSDAEGVAWSSDGQRLIVAWRAGRAEARLGIAREGAKGWLYDARVTPHESAQPGPPSGLVQGLIAVDVASHTVKSASSAEEGDFQTQALSNDAAKPEAWALDGSHAWTQPLRKELRPQYRIEISGSQHRPIACSWDACQGTILGLWWQEKPRTLIFLRKEGWNAGSMALYRWKAGGSPPRRILQTDGVISGCVAAAGGLICNSEEARSPRRVVRIDPGTGRQSLLFDPNPEWSHFQLGRVKRLTWINKFGLPSWGDLVLPFGYRPGTRLPLIITQYTSRGFLRGGTGDEFPVFPFSARGFAVLSLEKPPFYASVLPNIQTFDEANAANQKDWMERQNVLSSLAIGVDKLVEMGVADPKRVGITGLSDGASTVSYALINHPTFAAAAISTCCDGPHTAMTYGGIAWADWQHKVLGFPLDIEDQREFWRPLALSLNARKIDTPLLMQLSDKEFRLGLEAFSALREAGKPVEMHVFPDEYHEKVRPLHRLNSYNRSIDWFAFWLQGKEDPDPEKAEQYRRWEKMRASQPAAAGEASISPTSEPMPRHPPVP